jgi:hypothetical protein
MSGFGRDAPMTGVRPPKTMWGWLLLLTPAAIGIIFPTLGPVIERTLYPNESGEAKVWAWTLWGMAGSLIGIVLSIGLGIWLARGANGFLKKSMVGLFVGIVVLFINASIALAGCVIAQVSK